MASTIDVGLLGDFDGLGDLLAVLGRIAGRHFVLAARSRRLRDLAAFAVEHVHAVADLGLDAVEHGDVVLGHAAVAAEQAAVGVRADDGDGLELRRVERREVAVVLEQRDRLARGLQRQLAMRVAADDALGLVGIDVRIVEQAQLEFPEQHRRDQLVELRFLQHALADQLDQVQVAIRLGQFDVHAGLDGQRARLPSCPRRRSGRACRAGSPVPRWRSNRRRRSP